MAELRDLVVMFDDDDDQDDGSGSSGPDASTPVSIPGSGDDNTDDDDDDDDNADDRGDDDNGDDNDDSGDDGSRPVIRAFQSAESGEFAGAEDALVVEGAEDSDVGVDLQTLLAEPHVIAVFESDGSDTIIACGPIGGFVSADDDDLAVGLREQNDSGFAGVALLDDDDHDNELDVDVYIAREVVRD